MSCIPFQLFRKSIFVLEFTIWLRAAVNNFFDFSRTQGKVFGKERGNDGLPIQRDWRFEQPWCCRPEERAVFWHLLYALLAWQVWFSGHQELWMENSSKWVVSGGQNFTFWVIAIVTGLPQGGHGCYLSLVFWPSFQLKSSWSALGTELNVISTCSESSETTWRPPILRKWQGSYSAKQGKGSGHALQLMWWHLWKLSRQRLSSYINWVPMMCQFTCVEKLGIAFWVLFALRQFRSTYGTQAVFLIQFKILVIPG